MANTTTAAHTPTTTITNSTSDDSATKHSLLIFKIACLCAISIVGMIGNVTIFTTLFRRKLKSSEYFILNLALTDMMVCAIGIPLDIYQELHAGAWQYGAVLCKVIYPFQTLLVLISILTLTAMSLERYRAIMTPLKQLLRKPVIMASIGFIWCLGVAAVAPYSKILTYSYPSCEEKWPVTHDGNYYTLALFIIDYCIPLTIIVFCYSRAGFDLYRSTQQFKDGAESAFKNQNIAFRKRVQRNKHVIKVFSFAVLMFVVCMLPGDCYWMWTSFGDGSSFEYDDHLQTFTNILVYANSAINPFIFGACRMACFRVLCKRGGAENRGLTSRSSWSFRSWSSRRTIQETTL